MGKNRANEYCDVCKKIHRKEKCTELNKKESTITTDFAKSIISRSIAGMYFKRDRVNDNSKFIESEVVKEVDKYEPKRKRSFREILVS